MPNLYQNPKFVDNTAPPINAANLNALATAVAANQSYDVAVTIPSSGWSNGVITLAVSGVTGNTSGILTLAQNATVEQTSAVGAAKIRVTGQALNAISLAADGITPSVSIPAIIKIQSDGSMNAGVIVAAFGNAKDYIATTIMLSASGWVDNEQTVSVNGVTEDCLVDVTFSPSSAVEYVEAFVVCTAQGSGTLTFSCQSLPANDISVNVVIRG